MAVTIMDFFSPSSRTNLWRRAAASVVVSVVVLGALAALSALTATDHQAATAAEIGEVSVTPATSSRPITLHDRLVTGLQARLKSETDFVDHVVTAVESGRLPQRLVDQTFFWARVRAGDPRWGRPRRAIIYFQPAMTIIAKHLNVAL
jgi:hypothetical protein